MSQGDAAFGHHLDQVTGAELERQVTPHAQDNNLLVEMPAPEEILCRGRFRHPSRYRMTPSVSTVCTRTLSTRGAFSRWRPFHTTERLRSLMPWPTGSM